MDSAARFPTRFADTKATNKTVFKDRIFMLTVLRGSKGALVIASSTVARSQEGEGGRSGVNNLRVPRMNLEASTWLPGGLPSTPTWQAEMAARYTLIVEGDRPFCLRDWRKHRMRPMSHLSGSSCRMAHQRAKVFHLYEYRDRVVGALAFWMTSTTSRGRPSFNKCSLSGAKQLGSTSGGLCGRSPPPPVSAGRGALAGTKVPLIEGA